MTIREYKSEDAEGVKACILELQEAQHEHQPKYWKDSKDVSSEEILKSLLDQAKEGKGKLYVAEVDGSVVGYLCLNVNEITDEPGFMAKRNGHINDLVVLKAFQGKGIAGALVAQAEKYAKEQDCMYVSLMVGMGNSAVEFYKKAGYEVANQSMRKIL